jgi:hypothetical protein
LQTGKSRENVFDYDSHEFKELANTGLQGQKYGLVITTFRYVIQYYMHNSEKMRLARSYKQTCALSGEAFCARNNHFIRTSPDREPETGNSTNAKMFCKSIDRIEIARHFS